MTRRVLLGLIGENIMQSLAPTLHERALRAAGLEGHYHLMDFAELGPRASLSGLVAAVRVAGFAGVNVTFPVKEAVIELLDEVTPEAREIGAVNTIVVERDGRLTGHNTDRSGFRRGFEAGLGRAAVAGRTAVLVGAGGAGRAVAAALLDLGVGTLLIHDRDAARAAALAAEIGRRIPRRCAATADLAGALAGAAGFVNATPVGMLGHEGMPVPATLLRRDLWVADVIYTPLETALIAAARTAGARVMTGDGMCVHQAADAFRLFTGLEPDVALLERVFAEACAARDAALAASGRIARRAGGVA